MLFFKNGEIFKKIIINCETINSFCTKKINVIDVLKIDVEGSELEVILGAKCMLQKIKVIQIEVFDRKDRIKGKINKIHSLLKKHKFKIIKMKRIYLVSILSNIAAFDILLRNYANQD